MLFRNMCMSVFSVVLYGCILFHGSVHLPKSQGRLLCVEVKRIHWCGKCSHVERHIKITG